MEITTSEEFPCGYRTHTEVTTKWYDFFYKCDVKTNDEKNGCPIHGLNCPSQPKKKKLRREAKHDFWLSLLDVPMPNPHFEALLKIAEEHEAV